MSASVGETSSLLISSGTLASCFLLMPLAPGFKYVLSKFGILAESGMLVLALPRRDTENVHGIDLLERPAVRFAHEEVYDKGAGKTTAKMSILGFQRIFLTTCYGETLWTL
jgi:hypothetical protein